MTVSQLPVVGVPGEVAPATGPDGYRLCLLAVYGTPAPQGSKKHVGRGIMVESSKKLAPWREDVRQAALKWREYHGQHTFDGPLAVSMIFTLRKPTSAPKTRRVWPTKYPDLSKLLRSTEDAITSAGLWADDARVVRCDELEKRYVGDDGALDAPGAVITIRVMS